LRIAGGAFVLLTVGVVAHGMVSRAAQDSRLRALTEAQAVPTVAIVAPTTADDQASLDLPGRLEAYIRAPIYARVPGYLKSWKYDIGGRVKAGDVLAEIDTPDLDQQLTQARADLSVAEANAKLAQISAERWQSLASTDAVAKQDVDQRTFTWNANIAQVQAAQANVDRLVAEQGFKRLTAPFDGIVTARDTDIGALINVGAAGGAELFVVSETRKLRVYVNVPQNEVPSVPAGTEATIRVPEHPDKTYSGTVEASAQAVNPSTGTTLMQIIVDNGAGEMMPGDYDRHGRCRQSRIAQTGVD
jgi:RND family efflux transporter MFP subunit